MFENPVNDHSEKRSEFGKAPSKNLVDMTNPSEMRAIFGNRNSQRSEDDSNALTMTNPFGNSNWPHHDSQNFYSQESGQSSQAGQSMQPDQWQQNAEGLGNPTNSNQTLQTDLQQLATLVSDLTELEGALGGGTGASGSGSDGISKNSSYGADGSSIVSTQPSDSGSQLSTASSQPSDSGPQSSTASTQPSDSGSQLSTASSQPSDSGSQSSTASTQPSDSGSQSSLDNNPAPSDSTSTSSVSAVSSNLPNPESATISTPNGTATVGSSATVFGPQAMPATNPVANAFYVSADATGNGTGPLGSETDPFPTLQQAQSAMESSNVKTTYVEGGTYDLSSTLDLTSADSGESFLAAPGSGQPATIDGDGNVSNLVSVNGANDVSIEGLAMENTQPGSIFSSGDWTQSATAGDAIVAENSAGDNFSYDAISNVGMGLDMRGVSNSQLDSDNINNVQEAISFSSALTNSDNDTVDSNSISNVSDVSSSPYGAISLMQASDTTVGNNVIDNITGAGIRVGGNIGQNSNGVVVTQNTVENTNTAAVPTSSYSGQGDNGAIYAWQAPGNTNNMDLTISNNYVVNAGQGFENIGVYLDDGVDGATVTGNVIQPNGIGWATNIHGGSNNTVANNIFNLSSATGNEKGMLYQNDGPQMTNNNVSDNIFYSSTANGGAYTFYDNANDAPVMANNSYEGVTTPSQDTNPNSTNPQFVDPSQGNYTLQA
jgi:hypothetical protein